MVFVRTDKPLPERRKNDFYPTPEPFVRAALEHLDYAVAPKWVLDPGCGIGIWGEVATDIWHGIVMQGVEIGEEFHNEKPEAWGFYNQVFNMDFLDFKKTYPIDLICGNPPYSLGQEFIEHSFYLLEDGGLLVFLMRVQFLGAIKRYKFFKENPPLKVLILSRRPSFYGKDTRPEEYCLIYWKKGFIGVSSLDWLLVDTSTKIEASFP